MNPEFKKEAIKLAQELEQFMHDELDLATFLSYGSLLGCVRDGKAVPSDTDVDVSCMLFGNKSEVVKQIREIAWKLKGHKMLSKVFLVSGDRWENELHSIEDMPDPTGQLHIKSDKATVDLWIDWTDKQGDPEQRYINGCFGDFGYFGQFFPLKRGILEGVEFSVPNNPELWLSLVYGSDWKIPQPGVKRGAGLSKRQNYLYV